jgi:hypothetical protein
MNFGVAQNARPTSEIIACQQFSARFAVWGFAPIGRNA